VKLSMDDALALVKAARPMSWSFQASADGKKLSGIKKTTAFAKEARELKIDNSFERQAEWARLPGKVETPSFDTPQGELTPGKKVAISSMTPGATIRFTIDGSAPLADRGAAYSAPIALAATATLKAVAFKEGWQQSDAASAAYIVKEAKASYKKEKEGWVVELVSARQEADELILGFMIANARDQRREFILWANEARWFDELGNERGGSGVKIGISESDFAVGRFFSPGAPMAVTLRLKAGPEAVSRIKALDLNRGWLYFNDLPLPLDLAWTPPYAGPATTERTVGGVKASLTGLSPTDEGMLAEFLVVNVGEAEKDFAIWASESRIVDGAGIEYPGTWTRVGKQEGSLSASIVLPPGVPVKAAMRFRGEAKVEPLFLDISSGLFEFKGLSMPLGSR
jgi:hypothetical protein